MSEQPAARGDLEAKLRERRFVLTAETSPPLSADGRGLVAEVMPLKGLADAVNVTDGAGARAHMHSLAAARLLLDAGIEPILQLNTRDRNKLLVERELLGAAALGVSSVLCLSGDPIAKGDEPEATALTDLDSAGLVALAALLRDAGRLPCGREISVAPRYLLGAADNPVDPTADWQPHSLQRKLEAGADFIQTQFCFDSGVVRRYLARLLDLGIAERVAILVGIGPLRSARQAVWMRDNLPGTIMPDAVVRRLEQAVDPEEEGIRLCAELIEEIAEQPAAAGAHLMGPRSEAASAEAIRRLSSRAGRAAASA